MQLRRLELVGFKTFVDRTELEFHPGITAIVGPNGSGKSNIFDGIRWALGETSARMLRGARMEDVIFSGSASRRPLGLATVALTLDNSAGLLPVEFSEVTVSRAVTRGGEGEYAINGTDCRLRDVQMLFLGTGLGGRSYALIGQGEVDAVLRASPPDRRHWLEEAAGLARHKRHRVEAERRLDHARAHLDRLGDLADELDRQQQALAVQAEAATRHRAYTEELRDLELALYADEARRLLSSVRRLDGQLAAERAQADDAGRRAAEAAADAALIEAHLSDATAAWEGGQQRLLEGAEALRARAADVQTLEAHAERLHGQHASLEAEMARLQTAREALAADALVLGRETEDAEGRRAALGEETDRAEAALASAADAAEAAAGTVARQRDEALEAARALAQTRSDLAALRGRADVVGQAAAATAQRAGALGHASARLAEDHRAAREEADRARAALGAADAAAAASAAALEDRRTDLAAAADRAHHSEIEEHRLRVRLSSLEEAAAQFAGFEEGVRDVLAAAQQDPLRFPGLRGSVADLLTLPQEFRAAIAAALGHRVHGLVVDRRADIEPVVRFLRTASRGGATLLPLDGMRSRPGHPDAAGDGSHEAAGAGSPDAAGAGGMVRAADVVRVPEDLRPLVEALLGDVAIAEDLAAAEGIAAAGHPGRIATRDGMLLWPGGALDVGARANGEGAPLGRGQAIADLRRALAAAEDARARAHAARAAAAAAMAAADEALRSARAEREAAAGSLAASLQHLARLEAEAARLAHDEAAQAADARSATEGLERLEAEIRQRTADAHALEAEALRLEAQTLAAQDEARRLTEAREAAALEVTRCRLALVEGDGRLAAAQQRLADRTAALVGLDGRSAELEAAAGGLADEVAGVAARRDVAAAAYDGLVAEQAATKADVERLAAERVRLREALAQRQGEHAAAADAARSAEAAVHRTELRAAQADAELAAAAARLREAYGIALEDAAARRLEGPREEARRRVEDLRAALRELGAVNLRAIDEHAAVAARLEALRAQIGDLRQASAALRQAIAHINAQIRTRFRETFEQVNAEFGRLFQRLFEGGVGTLELVEDEEGGEPGLEVIAQLPGKKRRPLVALSGGERVLVALALIFAMLRVHPSPFCIFDEVEAALDDANTKRFTGLLRDLAAQTQVLIITHNKGTMAAADILYGVTMQEPGLSAIVSVRLVSPAPNGDGPPPGAGRPTVREPQVAALPAE